MFLLIGVVLLSSVITLISTAYGDDLSTQYRDCVNRTTSNYDWGQCGGHAVARQDARLNTAWKTALKCFDDSDQTQKDAKQALIEEERLWIIWKEKACNFDLRVVKGKSWTPQVVGQGLSQIALASSRILPKIASRVGSRGLALLRGQKTRVSDNFMSLVKAM